MCVSKSRAASTFTEPVSATRPRSFRMRSTIIASSAASFSLSSSSASGADAGRVPLIGRVRTVPSGETRRKSSGLSETTAPPSGSPTSAPNHDALRPTASAAKARRSPSSRAVKRRAMFVWNASPAWIASTARATAAA